MRIFHQQDSSYLAALTSAMQKDPASLEGWCCLYFMSNKENFAWPENVMQKLRQGHPQIDCDIVVCEGGDLICVAQMNEPALMYRLAALFMELVDADAGKKPEYGVYELIREWREVLAILKERTCNDTIFYPSHKEVDFGDVAALSEVFADAKKRRKSRKPQHIMVVEDDALTRRIVTGSFKEHYAIITAVNAHEAVASYLLHAPDIVFLDIGLPDASGFDVLQRIMKSDPDAYVVMFSGNNYLDNITRALTTGASGFVPKPFRRDKMQSYIEVSALHHHKYA